MNKLGKTILINIFLASSFLSQKNVIADQDIYWPINNYPELSCKPSLFDPVTPGSIKKKKIKVEHFEYSKGEFQPAEDGNTYYAISVYSPSKADGDTPLVILINGNGYAIGDYVDYANYLAELDYRIAVIDKSNASDNSHLLATHNAIEALFEHYELSGSHPLSIIGHSAGAWTGVDFINDYASSNKGYNVKSFIGVAPYINHADSILDNESIDHVFLLYGSQDGDVGGDSDNLTDAFGIYDRFGTEYTTTCDDAFCYASKNKMNKTMALVYGADHAGFFGLPQSEHCGAGGLDCSPYQSYLSIADQFCTNKIYSHAVLKKSLEDESYYDNLLKGKITPKAFSQIDTNLADAQGNPAGSDLNISMQFSPKDKISIENFEDQWYQLGALSGSILLDLSIPDYVTDPRNNRHDSVALAVAWEQQPNWQLFSIETSIYSNDASNMSHLSFRVGELNLSQSNIANLPGVTHDIFVGLSDGSTTRWVWSSDYAKVAHNDFKPDGTTMSVMGSVVIPLSRYQDIDLSNVEQVVFAFDQNTQGSIIIDNIEWFRNF